MSAEPIHIVDYDETWPQLFAELGSDLRRALGATAIRIDHIGSTAVPGLAAKPIIDVQVSVLEFEPLDAYRIPLAGIGLRHRENTDRTKRYFRERPGARRTHVHVRRVGSFSEQLSLLFRDYLRADAAAAREYASLKREFAARFSNDRSAYTDAKRPFIWETLSAADSWAQDTGWRPGPSDR